ncbi:MAG: helix-turn-helix transcriptional regulator [Lachnospiraceae bacterium]|nr:helix-turn-helix transcriptional regulator [Lachnospiraceae bacterium]
MKEISIGKKLRALRIKSGLKVRDVSKSFCDNDYPISEKTIYKWESDDLVPDIQNLNKILILYNETISHFFGNDFLVQGLDEIEYKFIESIRHNQVFRRIAYLLAKGG